MTQGPNKFIWYELMTTDQDAAEAFYRAVVGWSMADAGQPGMRYTILSAGDRGMGGLMKLPDEA
ncbi:MAG: VOC family protein, partial [Gammaproteobacteria bacterium]